MATTIYIITNKLDGMRYIGQTINYEARKAAHRNNKKDKTRLHRAIRKHGWENFEMKPSGFTLRDTIGVLFLHA